MSNDNKCDTLSVYSSLINNGFDENQSRHLTRILDSHYNEVEDILMNKFKEANNDVLKAISNLDRDVRALKNDKKDRNALIATVIGSVGVPTLFGFAAIAVAVYFGLNH